MRVGNPVMLSCIGSSHGLMCEALGFCSISTFLFKSTSLWISSSDGLMLSCIGSSHGLMLSCIGSSMV